MFQREILLPALVNEYELGFSDMVQLNKASALMLAEERIINQKAAARILQGLKKVSRDLKVTDLSAKYEKLYYNLEQALFATKAGPAK